MTENRIAAPAAKRKLRTTLKPLIAVTVAVYLGATAGFSYLLGALDPAPATSVSAPATPQEAVPQQIGTRVADLMKGGAGDRNESPTAFALTDETAGMDSVDAAEWLRRAELALRHEREAVDSQTQELTRLKQDVETLLAKVEETKSERVQMMARLYDTMDPAAVARQFGNINDSTVSMLLSQMNTRSAAKVMAQMEPKRAAEITTAILALNQ